VVTATLEESVRMAAQRVSDRNVGTLVVVDADDHRIGLITDRDLALRV
jgi:signal-transduction protein with cAMP-binding, CBS, and nucleotidyltransferase domain